LGAAAGTAWPGKKDYDYDFDYDYDWKSMKMEHFEIFLRERAVRVS
jgi:hypothetical protein